MFYFRHINEDKRKTEGQMEMFDIVNDIENCPVSISLSVSRSNICFKAFLHYNLKTNVYNSQ